MRPVPTIRPISEYPTDVQDEAATRLLRAIAKAPLVPESEINRLKINSARLYNGTPTIAMLRVLGGIACGLSLRQIADLTGTSRETLRFHVQRAQASLGCRSTTQAVAKAIRLGLI